MFLQQFIQGLTLGYVYALIALGYTMVYGILQLINFAHGEIYMLGAYMTVISFGFLTGAGLTETHILLSLVLSLLLSIIFVSAYGATIERIAYRPLRNAPRLSPLISAIGVSIFLQNFVMLTQGATYKVFPPVFSNTGLTIGSAKITPVQLTIIVLSSVVMIFLHFFISRTKTGKAMRAVAQDRVMASLVGIDTDRIIAITFIIGSALAGVAGFMVTLYYSLINYYMGYIAGIKAFTAAVLGGIGSIPGAMVGGLLLGLIEGLAAGYISSEYKDAYAFIVLIIILLIRPTGLFKRPMEEKV
ncbi:MAG: branched-chain amino acid ABC transporter permease [Thermodesulfovibrionales bacterium]